MIAAAYFTELVVLIYGIYFASRNVQPIKEIYILIQLKQLVGFTFVCETIL